MELRKKFRILFWAFILLIIINISTVFTFVYKNNATADNQAPQDSVAPIDFKHPGPSPKEGLFTKLLIDELYLTPEQIEEFKFIKQNFLEQSHVSFDSIRYFNEMIDSNLKDNQGASEDIELYASKIGEYHAQLKIDFVNYYANIYNILTNEQKEKLYDVFVEFKKQQNFSKHNNKHNRQHDKNNCYPNKQN